MRINVVEEHVSESHCVHVEVILSCMTSTYFRVMKFGDAIRICVRYSSFNHLFIQLSSLMKLMNVNWSVMFI